MAPAVREHCSCAARDETKATVRIKNGRDDEEEEAYRNEEGGSVAARRRRKRRAKWRRLCARVG
uniref:Uncharacterized protein n=1 Tax=Oryza meridionalis TaxID=40149 RepID=A0A0E0CAL1_9ORYZ